MTSGDIYGFLELKANNSNNFGNLTTWDAADGINATNFGIYVYAFDTNLFAGQDLIDIGLTGVPEGTFAIGFGEDSKGKSFDTPFTEAGLNDVPFPGAAPVPEPSSITILAGGIAALLLVVRQRRKTSANLG